MRPSSNLTDVDSLLLYNATTPLYVPFSHSDKNSALVDPEYVFLESAWLFLEIQKTNL